MSTLAIKAKGAYQSTKSYFKHFTFRKFFNSIKTYFSKPESIFNKRYIGEMINIETATGKKLSATPEHVIFAKKEGTYVVSLRRDGYQTRSYTLQIDTSEKDVRYSFSDLTPK